MSNTVPEGWSEGVLGDICKGIRGVSYKPTDLHQERSSETVTLLRSNNIQGAGLYFKDVQNVASNKVKPLQVALPGDIAVCMSNGSKRLVGKSAIFGSLAATYPFTVGAFCSIFRPTQDSESDFVSQLFKSDAFQRQVDFSLAGSAINNLKNGDLESYEFQLPPLPEQQKIATILTTVDNVIESTQAQINKLQDLKTGMMQELLTKGIGHSEFKDSPVGRIPEGWEVKELQEVGECVRGLTYSPDNVVENGLLVLRSSNISDGKLSFDDSVYVDVDVKEQFKVQEGDILICVRNGSKALIGKSATIHQPMHATHGAFMTVFRTRQYKFVQHLIKSDRFFQNVSRDIGATINSINNGNLLKYRFPFPPHDEQGKIDSILSSVDVRISDQNDRLNKLKSIKKALMQDLLTGKVRVKTD